MLGARTALIAYHVSPTNTCALVARLLATGYTFRVRIQSLVSANSL